jgi:hypothetical protein
VISDHTFRCRHCHEEFGRSKWRVGALADAADEARTKFATLLRLGRNIAQESVAILRRERLGCSQYDCKLVVGQ